MNDPGNPFGAPPPDHTSPYRLRVEPYRPDDAWMLTHRYTTAVWGQHLGAAATALLEHLAALPTRLDPTRFADVALPHQVSYELERLDHADLIYFDPARRTITTTGAVPSLDPETLPAATVDANRRGIDPDALPPRDGPATADGHYLIVQRPRRPDEHWPVDRLYTAGVWGHFLGHTAAATLRAIHHHLGPRSVLLPTDDVAAQLRITPRRLHAEFEHLDHHRLIDLDFATGIIHSSGYAPTPSPDDRARRPDLDFAHRLYSQVERPRPQPEHIRGHELAL